MQRLPRITDGQTAWRFPLSDMTAAKLSAALLQIDASTAINHWDDLLQDEPSLTLWTVCRAWLGCDVSLDSVENIAGWLSVNALEVLCWTDEELTNSGCASDDRIQEWSELTSKSIIIAHKSAQLASNHDVAEQAFLLGLLHGTMQWMDCCKTADSTPQHEATPCRLPVWLSESLEAIQRPTNQHSPCNLVHRALHQFSASHTTNESNESSDTRETFLDFSTHWRRSYPASQGSLPRLTRKLARLRKLEAEFDQTLEREKLASMKMLAYGASHEINNPLANIATRAQTLLRDETDPERRRKLAEINSQSFRAHQMISDMMLFARPPEPHLEPMDLITAIEQAISEFTDPASVQNTSLVHSYTVKPMIIVGDANHLVVAIKALVQNSLEALGKGGRIELSAQRVPSDSTHRDDEVEVTVCDSGPGIPAEIRRHIFDPFYCSREAGRGLGFGLSKCWRIVQQHEGRMEVNGNNGSGATFTIRLPATLNPDVDSESKTAST